MHRLKSSFSWFFFIALFCVSLLLTFQIHRDTGRFNWQSEIYSDGAGYYAYLPMTFLYHFDCSRFPAGINDSTGSYFIDHKQQKFVDKYTCGVAVMLSPFFGATVLASNAAGIPLEGGFSTAFYRMADIAAVCYLILGLFFLWKTLKRYTGNLVRYLVVIFIFLGTNLYFYTLRQPLMSHVYSFCIISIYFYCLHLYLEKSTRLNFSLVAFFAAMAMLIRPVNLIILILLLFLNTGSAGAVKARLKQLFSWWNIGLFLVIFIVVLLPQLFYWNFMYGVPVHYAYHGETFANWAHPRVAEIWFSPLNGLFLYNPVWLVFMAGVIYMVVKRKPNGILFLLFFLLTSYIIAAWHSWYFGCSCGHRAFIDFLPIFAIPFGLLLERLVRFRSRIPAFLMAGTLVVMSYFNLKIIYIHSGCFFGSVWDWEEFSSLCRNAGFWKGRNEVYKLTNDFENGAISSYLTYTDSIQRSYNLSVRLDPNCRAAGKNTLYFYRFSQPFPTRADAGIYVLTRTGSTNGGQLFCMIEREGQTLWQDSCVMDPFIQVRDSWCMVKKSFVFAPEMPWDATFSVEVRNPGRAHFYVDDLSVVFY